MVVTTHTTNFCTVTTEEAQNCLNSRELLINKGVPLDDKSFFVSMEMFLSGYVFEWERIH